MTNPQDKIDGIVMATINHGHQIITEQHKKEKSYVYVSGLHKLTLDRFEAKAAIEQLILEARIEELEKMKDDAKTNWRYRATRNRRYGFEELDK